jgi:glycosyltransferase involved in cell wall biosynthesis
VPTLVRVVRGQLLKLRMGTTRRSKPLKTVTSHSKTFLATQMYYIQCGTTCKWRYQFSRLKIGMTTKSTAIATAASSSRNVPDALEKFHSSSSWKGGKSYSVEVDVIVPVHNASSTLRETVASAMNQVWLFPGKGETDEPNVVPNITLYVCCYNDSSTDDSWSILQELQELYSSPIYLDDLVTPLNIKNTRILSKLCIASSTPGSAPRGPAWARNQAVRMRDTPSSHPTVHFLCWLDSDDVMHPTRIYHQVNTMMQLEPNVRLRTLLGTGFDRFTEDPTVSDDRITPHYTQWANRLSPERLYLERFREVTIIQPTWMMCRYRFVHVLHGYLEPPPKEEGEGALAQWMRDPPVPTFPTHVVGGTKDDATDPLVQKSHRPWRLVHPEFETGATIGVAEDLRLFHEHLCLEGCLQRVNVPPLVSYRHRPGVSQSARTPRKLLLALRVAAFEHALLRRTEDPTWHGHFLVWGAGRDGKDFIKALTPQARRRVYCLLDVDDAKITQGYYSSGRSNSAKISHSWHIPIVHFCLAIQDEKLRTNMYDAWKFGGNQNSIEGNGDRGSSTAPFYGHIEKSAEISRLSEGSSLSPPQKRSRMNPTNRSDPGIKALDVHLLPTLPVVVCVAMYRTGGALESNVELIGRTEGKDLWHIC